MSARSIQSCLDTYWPLTGNVTPISKQINISFDATFFGRNYGVLVFRALRKNVYWKEIRRENRLEVDFALDSLDAICEAGYLSFTIDGKRGIRHLLEERYPDIPIQYCQFHQKKTIRRYISLRPKTHCGKALNHLVKRLTQSLVQEFHISFKVLQVVFHDFLSERNENGQFLHKRLRSAFRSIKTNLPWLFTYQEYPRLEIPNTTNSCDGSFVHWKEKIQLHHGLKRHRRSKMIHFFLSQNSDSIS